MRSVKIVIVALQDILIPLHFAKIGSAINKKYPVSPEKVSRVPPRDRNMARGLGVGNVALQPFSNTVKLVNYENRKQQPENS